MRSGGCKHAHTEQLWLACVAALDGRPGELSRRIKAEPVSLILWTIANQVTRDALKRDPTMREAVEALQILCQELEKPTPKEIMDKLKEMVGPK